MTAGGELRELFEQLIDLPESERELHLQRLDITGETRERLRELLRHDTDLESASEPEPERSHPWPGERVNGFRLIAPIGTGGMGSVWLAVSRVASELQVAVKFPENIGVSDTEASGRLEQERRVLGQLRHPGVVSLVDAGETRAGTPFLILEAIEGETLERWHQTARPTKQQVAALLTKLAETLDYVHSKGFVHRDLKPANILVTNDGWPVLIDFGAARVTEEAAISVAYVTQGKAPHTPAFASPEQARGETATRSADVYGLGAVARTLLEAGDPELESILARACHAEAEERYATAGELGLALSQWALETEQDSPPRRPSWRRRVLWTVAIVASLFLGLSILDQEIATQQRDLLETLSAVPAVELPQDSDRWLDMARNTGDANCLVAAAVQLLHQGDLLDAAHHATGALRGESPLSGQRAFELAELTTRLDVPAGTMAALDRFEQAAAPEYLEEEAASLRLMAFARAGEELDIDEIRERLDEEEEHDASESLVSLGLGYGDTSALEIWIESFGEHDPEELEARSWCGLLDLRMRLDAQVELEPLEEELLEWFAEAALEGMAEEGEMWSALAWSRIVRARVYALEEELIDERIDLLEAALEWTTEHGGFPVTARAELLAILALHLSSNGEEQAAQEALASARESATLAASEESTLLDWIDQTMQRDLAHDELPDMRLAADPEEILETVDRELEGEEPWWLVR